MPSRLGIILPLALAAVLLAWCAHDPTSISPRHSHASRHRLSLRSDLSPEDRMSAHLNPTDLAAAVRAYSELTGRLPFPDQRPVLQKIDAQLGGRLFRLGLYSPPPAPDHGLSLHRDGLWRADEVKRTVEEIFSRAGLKPRARGESYFELVKK